VHDSTADMHCVSDMHHMNSLNAIVALLHHVHGAWSRDYGSIQLVWCAHLPLLIAPKEHVHGIMVHDSTADMHCVSDMHHMNSLNAIVALVHHVHGAWSRDYGSIQLVWCAHLPLLIAPKEHLPGCSFCLLMVEFVVFARLFYLLGCFVIPVLSW